MNIIISVDNQYTKLGMHIIIKAQGIAYICMLLHLYTLIVSYISNY